METPSFASKVDAPKWGVSKIFLAEISLWFSSIGSLIKTSIAAPEIISWFNASAKSFSLIIPPLATFIIFDVFFVTNLSNFL